MSSRDPFARAAEVPGFTITSSTVQDGQPLAQPQFSGAFGVPGGQDRSPQLSWSGAPEGTKSYAVTVYDPDAPTQSGFWHWIVGGLPATTTELPENAGDGGSGSLPEGAFTIPNDGGSKGFLGAAPPAGDDAHRYFITVFALDTDDVAGLAEASPAVFEFSTRGSVLARATLVPTGRIAAE